MTFLGYRENTKKSILDKNVYQNSYQFATD